MTKKKRDNYEYYKIWAKTVKMVQLLRHKDKMFLYEFLLIATIKELNDNKLRPVRWAELFASFPTYRTTYDRALKTVIGKGLIDNLELSNSKIPGRKRPFKLVVSPLGELLLKKYERVMEGLIKGS